MERERLSTRLSGTLSSRGPEALRISTAAGWAELKQGMDDISARIAWQPLQATDMDGVAAIAAQLHPALTERLEVLAEKLRLFPAGCRKLVAGDAMCGYALAHPWLLAEPPALDAFLSTLPADADCLFIHDVAVLPEARGSGAAAAYMAEAEAVARADHWPAIALIAAYGTVRLWQRFGFRPSAAAPPAAKLAAYGAQARYLVRRLTEQRPALSPAGPPGGADVNPTRLEGAPGGAPGSLKQSLPDRHP